MNVVGVLTDSPNPNNYWKVLKNRLKKVDIELVTNYNQLKMQSIYAIFYKTDIANFYDFQTYFEKVVQTYWIM